MARLLDLPDELLVQLISSKSLDLEDKMRLTSCCTQLRHLGNTAVPWKVGKTLPARLPAWQLASLRRWLHRKRLVLHKLLLFVRGETANEYRFPDIQGAKSLLASVNGGGLRALTIGLLSFEVAPDAGFAIGGWLAAAQLPQLRFLEIDSGSNCDHTVGADCLTRFTCLEALSLSCSWEEYSGLGQPGQPPFLPASLTSLELSATGYLPRLETATHLQRLVVNNLGDVFAMNTAGLEAATRLTALAFNNCVGMVFSDSGSNIGGHSASDTSSYDGSSDGDTSSGSDNEGAPFSSLVPLASFPRLRQLGLYGSIPEGVAGLPLASTSLEVLSMPRNPGVSMLPFAAEAIARSLRRLCCDIEVVTNSGAQLRELLALEELDVLLPTDELPDAADREDLKQQQQQVLAALRGPPRLRLVGVEANLAAVLGGFEGSRPIWPAMQPAIKATLAGWAQQLPGKRVVEMTTALGPARPLPNFDRPEWDTVNVD